jgi:hypothetical protein
LASCAEEFEEVTIGGGATALWSLMPGTLAAGSFLCWAGARHAENRTTAITTDFAKSDLIESSI